MKVGAGGTAPDRYELPRCSRCGRLLHYGKCAKAETHNAEVSGAGAASAGAMGSAAVTNEAP